MIYHPETVFTRTTKGIREARSTKLPRELSRVFAAIDGKSNVANLVEKSGIAEGHCHLALDQLMTEGYIRLFSTPDMSAAAIAAASADVLGATGKMLAARAASAAPATAPAATKPAASPQAPVIDANSEGDELDFTSEEVVAKVNAEAVDRAKAENEARARAEVAGKAAAEAKLRQDAR